MVILVGRSSSDWRVRDDDDDNDALPVDEPDASEDDEKCDARTDEKNRRVARDDVTDVGPDMAHMGSAATPGAITDEVDDRAGVTSRPSAGTREERNMSQSHRYNSRVSRG